MRPDTATGTGLSNVPAYDVYAPLRDITVDLPGLAGLFVVLNTVWNSLSLISFLFSALFIFGTIYAMQRMAQLSAAQTAELREAEAAFAARTHGGARNSRWQDVVTHISSPNPNDWRLAIIEADIMLEEALDSLGLAGGTIGEKLKSASPNQMRTLDDAWKAHRVRNEIAHAGADFVLTQKLAQETINQYERVFQELGAI